MDVKTAFLHGDLKEDVYVAQSEGFEVNGSETQGIKTTQSVIWFETPRAWNEKLNRVLEDLGFVKC